MRRNRLIALIVALFTFLILSLTAAVAHADRSNPIVDDDQGGCGTCWGETVP